MKGQTSVSIKLLLLSVFIVMGCLNHSTPVNNKVHPVPTDTVPAPKSKSAYQQEIDDGVPSLSAVLSDELNSYKDTTKVDTVFLLSGNDSMFIKFRHYCTFDNKINVPVKFLKLYGLSKFQTHNFVSTLEMRINSKIVYNGVIRKGDFSALLDEELKKYAVLSGPNIKFVGNRLDIDYSISIPLSDVGKGVTVAIDTLGNKHVSVSAD
jgi:hypothetical protein